MRRVLQRLRQHSGPALARLERSRSLQLAVLLSFAAATIFAESAYSYYSKEITRYKVIGFEFLWQIPVGYLLLFGPLALVTIRPSGRSLRAVVFLGCFVTAAALIPIVVSGLYFWAVLILAAGIALQATRLLRTEAWLAIGMTRMALPAGILAVLMATGFLGWRAVTERRAVAALPNAPAGPNVLLLVLDTVRARSLGLYGYERATSPALDQFARKGVVFDRAYATSPWTLPSHGSMFTGRLPHELSGSFSAPMDAAHPTVAEVLGRRGYLTAGFVANTWYGGSAWGLGRGFQHYEDTETSAFNAVNATSFGRAFIKATGLKDRWGNHENLGRKSAAEVNEAFLDWLADAPAGRPFFAFLNYCDAHAPYAPPAPFNTKFAASPPRGDVGSRRLDAWSPDEVRQFRDSYDSAIAYLDNELRTLFQALETDARLRNTLVIVTSDHGEQFGEHGLLEHVNSLYMPLLHVPLVIVGPGVQPAERVGTPISLRDLAATILKAAGADGASEIPGESLLSRRAPASPGPVLLLSEVERAQRNAYPDWYPAQRGRMKTIISAEWQYIRNFGDGKEELFDLTVDPLGLTDKAALDAGRLVEYRTLLNGLVTPVK